MCSAICSATTVPRKAKTLLLIIGCRITAAWSGSNTASTQQLRGRAGAQSVLVNNLGYRQTENIWSPAEPGHNVVLTIDLDLQQAAEDRSWRTRARTRGRRSS